MPRMHLVAKLPKAITQTRHKVASDLLREAITFGALMGIAKILSMIAQIMIGRHLGPALYGELTVIMILANYLSIPMINGWGLAYVRLVSAVDAEEKHEYSIRSLKPLLLITIAASLVTTLVLYLWRKWLCAALGVTHETLILAMTLAMLTAWFNLAKQVFQATQDWRIFNAIELSWALALILGVAFSIAVLNLDTQSAALIFIFAYLASGMFAVKRLLKSLFTPIYASDLRELSVHGALLFSSAILSSLAFGLDRLLINHVLDSTEVGIYQAHFFSTYGTISTLSTIILTYLFPLFSQKDSSSKQISIPGEWVIFSYPTIFLLSVSSGFILMSAYGYPIDWSLIILFCIFNCLQFHSQLLAWRIAGAGPAKTRLVVVSQLAFLLASLIVLAFTITHLGALAGALSLISASAITLLILIASGNGDRGDERLL